MNPITQHVMRPVVYLGARFTGRNTYQLMWQIDGILTTLVKNPTDEALFQAQADLNTCFQQAYYNKALAAPEMVELRRTGGHIVLQMAEWLTDALITYTRQHNPTAKRLTATPTRTIVNPH